MNRETLATLMAALLSGSALPWAFKTIRRILSGTSAAESDRLKAQARKLNAEADRIDWQTLSDEIRRLDRELAEVRAELGDVKKAALAEKAELERENRRLKAEVRSLRRRVAQLEEIITTKTTPEDMRAQLAEIDRKTANDGKAARHGSD